MFRDCITDIEKNEYKRSKKLQLEVDAWLKEHQPDFYRCQRLGAYHEVFSTICERVEIPDCHGRFVHFIDYRYLFDTTRGYRFENFTPGYERVIAQGLSDLKYPETEITNKFCKDYNSVIDAMISLAERISSKLRMSGQNVQAKYFMKMINEPATCLEDALQRILFVNQLFWQMGHRLVGAGHLDWMLEEVYCKDIQSGVLTKADAYEMILDFMKVLHREYWLKSNVLMGDTGQIIILGGKIDKRSYRCNDLTFLMIRAIKELQLPDPKLLLRVSEDMPRELMELALTCIQTGVGSPLLSNDDIIIPRLHDFGITYEDAYQYGTSACWEPLIPGKSISPNNMTYLSYPKVLHEVWKNEKAFLADDFSEWLEIYKQELSKEIERMIASIAEHRLQYNPLLSIFTADSYERKTDVSIGGAVYNNYGITTVGLSNVINSLLNLKKYVFEDKQYSLQQVYDMLQNDFADNEVFRMQLKTEGLKYGSDEEEVIELSNDILRETTSLVKDYRNYLGGKLKLGVSAPSYVDASRDFPATFDGRKKGEPFGVHISLDRGNGYTEIINFAAALDYRDNRFNGNVVDFMISPHFIEQNFSKMADLLMAGVSVGFFQLQMNVIDSDILIAAKKNPEAYQGLVVRVWGFSAYFHELPEAYQDVLIQRAL